MKKGKLFEKVIRIVQEALKNVDSTKIYQNLKLLDNCGVEREFDIFIKLYTPHAQFNIAIECKDYNRKIEIGKIDEFQSKCSDLPKIHRKIFVSREGFQSGAIAKAKHHDIELLLLKKVSKEIILNWLQISIPVPIHIDRILASPTIKFIGKPFNIEHTDILEIPDNGIEMTLIDFMKAVVEQNLPQQKLVINTTDKPKPKIKTVHFSLEFPLAFLKKGELKSPVSNLWFNVEHHYKDLKSEVSFDEFSDLNSENEIAQSVTVVSENNDVYSFVKKKGQDEIEIVSTVNIGDKEEVMKIGNIKIEKISTTPNHI